MVKRTHLGKAQREISNEGRIKSHFFGKMDVNTVEQLILKMSNPGTKNPIFASRKEK